MPLASILDWLRAPRAGGCMHVLQGRSWRRIEYEELAARALGVSAQLRDGGLGTGEVVAIADEAPEDFVCSVFGALHAGATVAVLPPATSHPKEAFARARDVGSTLVIAGPQAAAAPWLAAGISIRRLDNRPASWAPLGKPAEVSVLQFTSGSTARPRVVQITPANLTTNVNAIAQWLCWRDGDASSLWLPFHHDMGLIGLIVTIAHQGNLWQSTPRQFLTSPRRWLEPLGDASATVTAAPTFAYSYVARRLRHEDLAGLDFGTWRHAIVGAERVSPAALTAVDQRLRTCGFQRETFRPAYGMAEGTLALAGVAAGRAATSVHVRHGLRFGQHVDAQPTEWSAAKAGRSANEYISCGSPLADVSLWIADDHGAALPEGHLGEIWASGASISPGYLGDDDADATNLSSGAVQTGDVGFLHAGELYVVGRMTSSFKVRGRHIAAEAVESFLTEAFELPTNSCVVVPLPGGTSPRILVGVEPEADIHPEHVVSALRRHLGGGVTVEVETRPIPRTMSGKPRRREVWRQASEDRASGSIA